MRGTGELTYREKARIKALVFRAAEADAKEIARLKKRVYELARELIEARESRDRWKRAAYRCGGWHRDKVMQ